MKRILSIDGGGMKGLIPATVLCQIEKDFGKPCHEVFDLVAGTSIGGILACLIGAGLPAADCVSFFTVDGPKIFGRERFFGNGGFEEPRYGVVDIERVLSMRLGARRFNELSPRVIATAYDVEAGEGVVFKSWEASEILAWQVARSTSAAQTYFPAFEWRDNAAGVERVLWDGGVLANNPAGIAYSCAAKLWPGEEIALLSLGCGASRNIGQGKALRNAGLMAAASHTLNILFEGSGEVAHMELDGVLPRYVRIQPPAPGVAMNDATPPGIRKLQDAAHACVEDNRDRLQRYESFIA